MALPSIPDRCDVVVIGAGMGGLTSAALMAKAGLDVVVLEMCSRPGGYLAGFRRGHFCFDTAIHWLNQCGEGGIVRTVLDLVGPGAPLTPPLKRIRRYKGDAFDYLLTDEPDAFRDALIADFPAEAKGIRRFFAAAKTLGNAFAGLSKRTRSPETMSLLEKAKLGLDMTRITVPFWRHLGVSADKGLANYFDDERVKALFCSEQDILSCLVPIGWAYHGDYQLPPRGGSQQFPAFLTRALESWGASVVCRARVEEVLVEETTAVGVRLVRGRKQEPHTIHCDTVVAACDQQTVYERMLPEGICPPRALARLRDAELYDSSVTLSFGLSVPPRDLGFDEELILLTRDDVTRDDHSSGDPHTASISVLAPSLRDPSLAPEGKGTLTAYVPASLDYGDRWKTGPNDERGDAYKAFKQDYADVLIDRIQAGVAPRLREHVEFCEVATPVTHLRYTGNRGGSIMAQRPTRPNMRAKVAHYSTPVRNLLIGGHWAEYGGGVPVAVRAGMNSALIVLKRLRPEAYAVVRDVVEGKLDPSAAQSPALKDLELKVEAP